jgi:TPR repeat protein
MADIFISYAREDIGTARAIARALGARGWSVFWDRRIPHGSDFGAYLQFELDSAQCIVVLWSKASVASQFVRDEAAEGQNGRLVPVLIEPVRQPLGFRQLQTADLTEWNSQVEHEDFGQFVASVEAIVSRAPGTTSASSPSTPTSERKAATAGGESARQTDAIRSGPASDATDPNRTELQAHERPVVWPTHLARRPHNPPAPVPEIRDTSGSEATVPRQPQAPRPELPQAGARATSAAPKGRNYATPVSATSAPPVVPVQTATSHPPDTASTRSSEHPNYFRTLVRKILLLGFGFSVVVALLVFWLGSKAWELWTADLNTKCEKGDAAACLRLADNYERGEDGYAKDPVRSSGLYRRACDGGSDYGCYKLGVMHEKGEGGLLVDMRKARELYEKACLGGLQEVCNNLGLLYERGEGGLSVDLRKARELYEKACDARYALACSNLGSMQRTGGGGLSVDMVKARELYKKACDGGSQDGCINLGVMYERGEGGLSVDVRKARELYEKTCDSGSLHGCGNLGVMYERGEGGLSVDLVKARELYKKACDGGSAEGCRNLEQLRK